MPSDILAAFLYAQLEKMAEINKQRHKLFDYYLKNLTPLASENHLTLPSVPPESQTNTHLFYILLKNGKAKYELMDYLQKKGIMAIFHFVPLHSSPIGKKLGYKVGQFPKTEEISDRLLRLPFYFGLERKEQKQVVNAIKEFFARKKS